MGAEGGTGFAFTKDTFEVSEIRVGYLLLNDVRCLIVVGVVQTRNINKEGAFQFGYRTVNVGCDCHWQPDYEWRPTVLCVYSRNTGLDRPRMSDRTTPRWIDLPI